MWSVSEVARLRVVSPSIDGPNVALVIRFEREGEERFARDGLVATTGYSVRRWSACSPRRSQETQLPHCSRASGKADDTASACPIETVAMRVKLVASMGADEPSDFEIRRSREG